MSHGALRNWALDLPWAPGTAPRLDTQVLAHMGVASTDVSAGPGPASDGPGAGPSLISPACQDAKLENPRAFPSGGCLSFFGAIACTVAYAISPAQVMAGAEPLPPK